MQNSLTRSLRFNNNKKKGTLTLINSGNILQGFLHLFISFCFQAFSFWNLHRSASEPFFPFLFPCETENCRKDTIIYGYQICLCAFINSSRKIDVETEHKWGKHNLYQLGKKEKKRNHINLKIKKKVFKCSDLNLSSPLPWLGRVNSLCFCPLAYLRWHFLTLPALQAEVFLLGFHSFYRNPRKQWGACMIIN